MTSSHPTEWNAASYHAISRPQFEWGQAVLARLPLQGTETVLDAGCGSGRLTAQLLRRLPHGQVWAVDQSHRMLESAQETLGADTRMHYQAADLAQLTLPLKVDAIFSTATFHWILDHDALFSALARALKPGGRLVAQCGGEGNLARLHHRVFALRSQAPYAEHFAGWTEPTYFADAASTRARLQAAGFVDLEVWIHEAPTPFESAEALRTFLTTVVLRAELERLPSALREPFLTTLLDQAAADMPPFVLDYQRLNIVARRRSE